MHCSHCHHTDTKVLDSRLVEEGMAVRRRRQCEQCHHRFTTFERRSFADLFVEKKDTTIEYYDRQKLLKSLTLACVKRPISLPQLEELVRTAESKWMSQGTHISSKVIGADILKKLKELDIVAYIRFASVYGDFSNIEDFSALWLTSDGNNEEKPMKE